MASLNHNEQDRKGNSFGINLTPSLIHSINPLHDANAPELPNPDTVGTLDTTSIDTLYNITLYAQTKWVIDSKNNALDKTVYTNFINFKTDQVPSYYTAYQETLKLYNDLIEQLGSEDKALEYLYTPNPQSPPENWDVVRNWAIKEFLILFTISGNFRQYQWMNFPGWMGTGPFNNPENLPYRGINYGK